MLDWTKKTFVGGMRAQFDPSKLSQDEYPLLVNGRTRDDTIIPNKKPVEITGFHDGAINAQGVYGMDTYLLFILDGRAYIKNFEFPNSNFQEIQGVLMNGDAQFVYAELVPSSSQNFQRVSDGGAASDTVELTSPITQTPATVVLQDGITQPNLISFDGQGRVSQNYGGWTPDNPEYIPVGLNMACDGVVLYIVSPDRRRIYRSVSGQFLNFMVVIGGEDGNNKVTEDGIDLVSYATTGIKISNITATNTATRELYVGSGGKVSHFITPDLNRTMFNEPLFSSTRLFATAANNQFSFIEIAGDQILIDPTGIRSFNSVLQVRNEGENTLFSKQISRLFERGNSKIVQEDTCAVNFNNFGLFAVNTIYGEAVVVYDETLGKFVGIDIYSGVTKIKMFAEIKVNGQHRLFFITDNGKLFEAYAHEDVETCKFYHGDFAPSDPRAQQLAKELQLKFTNVTEAGIVTATLYVDGKENIQREVYVSQQSNVEEFPIALPFGDASNRSFIPTSVAFDRSVRGTKLGVFIEWNFQAELIVASLSGDDSSGSTSQEQRVNQTASLKTGIPSIINLTPDEGIPTTNVVIIGNNLDVVENIYTSNNILCPIASQSKTQLVFVIPENAESGQIKLGTSNILVKSESSLTIL